jgi:hypothetical protein
MFKRASLRNKFINIGLSAVLAAAGLLAAAPQAGASGSVTVIPVVTTNISIDTTSSGSTPAWTLLSGLVIQETSPGQIKSGLHTFTLPAGWEFNTFQTANIGVSGTTDFQLSSSSIAPYANSISFYVIQPSTTGPERVTFDGNFYIRPTGTVTPGTVNITQSAGNIDGVTNGVEVFGTIGAVPGVATKIKGTIYLSTLILKRI